MKWIDEGKKLVGLKEVKGAKHAPEILQMWRDIKRSGIKDDETPWCAAFVGAMLERAGIKSSRFESARSYLDWGVPLAAPAVGCVVVFARSGGGHVGFVVGQDNTGNLLVLGGNQADAVSVAAFPLSRVLGYRWPAGEPLPALELPVFAAAMSRSEA
ncbi:MAG: TIGR02594 family protein [Laribacter sp.]|nr:TIGR02594 family protein [Laribacter sp.]MBP9527573.1 TIGR02594 family protein [Laribacter sp.]MBP9608532.1 TIGR02594 family protein [Laribacter sp.]